MTSVGRSQPYGYSCGTWAVKRGELWRRQLFPALLVVLLIYGVLESVA